MSDQHHWSDSPEGEAADATLIGQLNRGESDAELNSLKTLRIFLIINERKHILQTVTGFGLHMKVETIFQQDNETTGGERSVWYNKVVMLQCQEHCEWQLEPCRSLWQVDF